MHTALRKLLACCPCLLLGLAAGSGGGGGDARGDEPAAVQPPVPQWIWHEGDPAAPETVIVRKSFDLPEGELAQARLYVAVDEFAHLFVNDELVLRHEGWKWIGFKDVSHLLHPGKNVIVARVQNKQEQGGVLVQLSATAQDGSPVTIVSDDTWRATREQPKDYRAVDFDDSAWAIAKVVGELGTAPWNEVTAESLAAAANLREPAATPIEHLRIAKGFEVELLYSVPRDQQGSWVNMCVDPRGRLIVSDQSGGLYRITPAAVGDKRSVTLVEPLELDIGEAQGLLWAFDSLYVVVNAGGTYESGLYRVQDTDGDGELDSVRLLRALAGGGEHGPHAVLLSPDGESLTVVCGDATKLPELASSRVPKIWDEDLLLPRLYGRGFMKGVPAPGGYIAKTDPEGETWELIAAGFRNQFDAAFNREGELFTYDADMEWDINTPWYRPTRVCHVVSGVDFGWRNGSGKWPAWYPESLPAAVNVGPGSPTGVCFGYGARFPEKFQNAMYLCDWSYGKLYAATLEPQGSTYTGSLEEFVTGTPLPLTDVVVNPHDGAMYFTIGGRRVQSGLYRVTYKGDESVAASAATDTGTPEAVARDLRQQLEGLHHEQAGAVDTAWGYLQHPDRFIRHAARVVIEHQPLEQWRDKALAGGEPQTSILALLALARRQGRPDSLHDEVHDPVRIDYEQPLPDLTGVDLELKAEILTALDRLDWNRLPRQLRLDLLRVYTVTLARMGPPDEATRQPLIARFQGMYPAESAPLNAELCRLLIYLQAPGAAEATLDLLGRARTQEEQIDYALPLRFLHAGWTDELFRAYFSWFTRALTYRGGANFTMFIDEMKVDATRLLSDEQKVALQEVLDARPEETLPSPVGPPRTLVQEWGLEELLPIIAAGMHDRNYEHGREMFAAAKCFNCHRFNEEGGAVGPDLTSLAGRFSQRDLLESIVDPNKVISDQYAAVQIVTIDGQVIVGRIINLVNDTLQVSTNLLDPNALAAVDRKHIDEMLLSKVSMMPAGLLNTFEKDEVLDLMAYLLSRGDPRSSMFSETQAVAVADPGATPPAAAGAEPPSATSPPAGFRALFNGVDMSGWHGMPHFDPRKLAELSEEERQSKIAAWTAEAKEHWTVENEELVNDGRGPYLTTDEDFTDYELLIDYKTVALADSGIYLRGIPQVQIWDYTEAGGKWDRGADKGSGGLWNNSAGSRGKLPLVLADKPFGEWNSLRIRQTGARVSVWMNDQLVVDHAILENYWDRSRPVFPKGPFQLQTHGGEIRWRNIFVREIDAEEANRILRENGEGAAEMGALFNGRDLEGWQGATGSYEVVNGILRCKPRTGGVLFTREEFEDFVLQVEFKLPPKGNNGLAIRYPGEGDPAFTGMCEVQILDSDNPAVADRIDPRQAHGSAYGMIPAHRGYLRGVGEWNFERVRVEGSKVTVELNGTVILDGDLSQVSEFLDNRPHPGRELKQGFLGFAGHSDPVEFRRVEVRRLN